MKNQLNKGVSKLNPTNVFAQKHAQALGLLGYRYVLLDPNGEVCDSTIDKYLVQRGDGRLEGTLETPKEPASKAKRARKRRQMIRFNDQTHYIKELHRINGTPGACTVLNPPANVTAQAMRHAVHSAGLRLFGKGNFETAVVEGQIMVFYKGPELTQAKMPF
jgi:hypothetical protein